MKKLGLKNTINHLPKTAGVYLFFARRSLGKGGLGKSEIIYIGKAINIKDRVKNHFQQPSYRDNLFIEKVDKIGFINTDSEIEALILEANLIKKHQPKFNVVWKDGKNYFYVAIAQNNRKVPYIFITHQIHKSKILNHKSKIIGPFVEGNALKKTLKYLRRIFPYYTTTKHPKNACTWCHLGLCPGPRLFAEARLASPSGEAANLLAEYKKNIKKLSLILEGKRKIVLNNLKREMQAFSKMNKFEEAGKIRDRIRALEQVMLHTKVIENTKIESSIWYKTQEILQKILRIKKEISKIECYDISNIQGKYAVGSMVVFKNGAPDKSQYKKFSIRVANASDTNIQMHTNNTNKTQKRPYKLLEEKPNDIAMLKQVLTRRLMHPEWGYPDVMLIDGGIAQLNVAIKAKNESLTKPTAVDFVRQVKNIKIISIAKGKRELLIAASPKRAGARSDSETRREPRSNFTKKFEREGKPIVIPLKNLPQEIYNLIVHLDDEAHRFAITYHKKVRKKALLDI